VELPVEKDESDADDGAYGDEDFDDYGLLYTFAPPCAESVGPPCCLVRSRLRLRNGWGADDEDDDFEDVSEDEDGQDLSESGDGTLAVARAMRKENATAEKVIASSIAPVFTAPVIHHLPTRSVVVAHEREATRTKVDVQALSRSRRRWKHLVASEKVKLTESTSIELFDRKPSSLFAIQCLFGTANRHSVRVQVLLQNLSS
jgi:hypothetical protein